MIFQLIFYIDLNDKTHMNTSYILLPNYLTYGFDLGPSVLLIS